MLQRFAHACNRPHETYTNEDVSAPLPVQLPCRLPLQPANAACCVNRSRLHRRHHPACPPVSPLSCPPCLHCSCTATTCLPSWRLMQRRLQGQEPSAPAPFPPFGPPKQPWSGSSGSARSAGRRRHTRRSSRSSSNSSSRRSRQSSSIVGKREVARGSRPGRPSGRDWRRGRSRQIARRAR